MGGDIMADEIRQYSVTIPAGTQIEAPFRKDVSFPSRIVQQVEITVPPGPSGLMGFALQNSGVTIIPYGSDPFIVASDERMIWPLHGYVDSGSWQIQGYNLDLFPHTVYVRFLLGLIPPAPAVPGAALAGLDNLTSASGANLDQVAAAVDAEPVP